MLSCPFQSTDLKNVFEQAIADSQRVHQANDSEPKPSTSEERSQATQAAVLGTLQEGQSWEDFKAKLMTALIKQGVINDEDEKE